MTAPGGRTLRHLLDEGREMLACRGNREAELDARYLLLEAFGLDLAHFLLDRNRALDDAEETRQKTDRYFSMIRMRADRVPLQQILGVQDFMGLTFRVNAHVLIPRQDTETLVELVLREQSGRGKCLLDLCTGSGCIAVSLAALGEFPRIAASDLSAEALAVAEKNRDRLLDGTKRETVSFFQGDLFSALPEDARPFDVLVSNPPYIPSGVIETLEAEVRDFEPRMALDGSPDGLAFYRRILGEGRRFLKPGGAVYLEIGWDQGQALRELFAENGFVRVRILKDAPGKDRVAAGCLPPA